MTTEEIAPNRKLVGERTPWPDAAPADLVVDANGDSVLFGAPPIGGAVIIHTYREATVPPLVIHFTNWHDGWAEFRAHRDHINGGTDPDERCWNGFCIAGDHPRSAQHVDATGHTWTQPRTES